MNTGWYLQRVLGEVSDGGQPSGLAIDWVGRRVYVGVNQGPSGSHLAVYDLVQGLSNRPGVVLLHRPPSVVVHHLQFDPRHRSQYMT
jgi:hypothetical protein